MIDKIFKYKYSTIIKTVLILWFTFSFLAFIDLKYYGRYAIGNIDVINNTLSGNCEVEYTFKVNGYKYPFGGTATVSKKHCSRLSNSNQYYVIHSRIHPGVNMLVYEKKIKGKSVINEKVNPSFVTLYRVLFY